MSKIANAFKNGPAFIGFLTGGDPNLRQSLANIEGLIVGGADLIEIGIPFSDPVAEGPVIQAANNRALAAGTTTEDIFSLVASVRLRSDVPVVLLTYLNPVFVYGYDRFFARCAASGVDGIIIPDLPYEEKGEIADFARQSGIDLIALVAPSSEGRIRQIVSEATGFIYVVSSLGVTGVRSEIETDLVRLVTTIKQVTNTPVAVGFGISTPRQAAAIARICDGVIVGSALVKIAAANGITAAEKLSQYAVMMKEAMAKAL
ncbi:MAG: tryptophan synthase subunit alpha [Bacillota bacterium]|nr:tryptophan synthase subunit alpha [Bacillota bacterium]